MSELIAQGAKPDQRWRITLPPDQWITLGRTTATFRVPWDDRISREHVRMRLLENGLEVEKLASSSNPVFYYGRSVESCWIVPGEHFVIGKTTFTVTLDRAHVTLDVPHPLRQKSFSPQFLHQVQFRDAQQRIDVLNRLPDLISSASNQQDLYNHLSNTLLAGMPTAATVAVVRLQPEAIDSQSPMPALPATEQQNSADIEIIHWDRRESISGDFQPSATLIRQAIESDETVLHFWQRTNPQQPEFTVDLNNDWAFLCPLDSAATPRWGIYVTGSQPATMSREDHVAPSPTAAKLDSDAADLQGDIKFCELVGSMLKNVLLVKQLERRQAGLRSFFSPIVLAAIADRDPDVVLAPQEVPMSVMFCDLRGFVKTSEEMSDQLFQLLHRVSQSLAVVTNKILSHSGVIGDFHGDSAMGFWGWPLNQHDTAVRAIRAALDIKQEFHTKKLEQYQSVSMESPRLQQTPSAGSQQRPDFQIGIGIATGVAVAGKIGTRDQVKVTAFGPVVNLASRLEGMNRLLASSILIDRATMDQIADQKSQLKFRLRRMGMIQPLGMHESTEVFQVLDEFDALTESNIEKFESALIPFQTGDWTSSIALLNELPDTDGGKQFLLNFMRQTSAQPPRDWAGVITLNTK